MASGNGTIRLLLRTLLGLLLVLPCLAHAEIFKYRGADGSLHFTDRPLDDSYKLLWRSGATKKKRSGYSAAKMAENRSKYTPLIAKVSKELRLHPGLLHAMVLVESAYNPVAISKRGARGLMQLMPETASRYGVDNILDPRQNLEGGARYLSDLLREFEYDIKLALAAYNAGENAVKRYGNNIPPFPETINYVDKVLGEYERNRLAMVN
jgi:soluble lytic murein transglycosylase-like protein